MEERDVYLIPRNINKPDTIIHTPVPLNWTELAYLGMGVGGIVWAFNSTLPSIVNVIIIATTGLMGIFGAAFRYEGLMIHELIGDVIMYVVRKLYYKDMI